MKKYFVYSLVLFTLSACNSDDDVVTVDSSVPLYQDLRVEFNATQQVTYASADFNKENSQGASVQLTGSSSILFNGQTPDFTDAGPYFYNFNFPGFDDIEFTLTREPGEVYTNTVSSGDIDPLDIVKDFNELSLQYGGETFVWFGRPVGEGETVRVRVVTNSGEYDFHTSEAGSISVNINLPPTVTPGTAQFYLSRIKILPLQQDNKGAGGQIEVIYTCEKKIQLVA